MILSTLTDAELLRVAHQHDPLVTTAMQDELLARFERLTAEHDSELYERIADCGYSANELGDILDVLQASSITPSTLGALCSALIGGCHNSVELLEALLAHDVDTPESLKAQLELADKFRAVLVDGEDVFARLSTLSTAINQE